MLETVWRPTIWDIQLPIHWTVYFIRLKIWLHEYCTRSIFCETVQSTLLDYSEKNLYRPVTSESKILYLPLPCHLVDMQSDGGVRTGRTISQAICVQMFFEVFRNHPVAHDERQVLVGQIWPFSTLFQVSNIVSRSNNGEEPGVLKLRVA